EKMRVLKIHNKEDSNLNIDVTNCGRQGPERRSLVWQMGSRVSFAMGAGAVASSRWADGRRRLVMVEVGGERRNVEFAERGRGEGNSGFLGSSGRFVSGHLAPRVEIMDRLITWIKRL
ncbi:hypothetical protein HAX54_046230, partial [Datura stramonium]|nr:hypothetical protein [Datura stramonium]